MLEISAFLLIGALTGVAAGLLGIGGGLIIVPFSLIVFDQFNDFANHQVPYEIQAHVAIATSLATIIFTSLSAIYSQHKKHTIIWSVVWLMMPGILLGAFCGSWVATLVPRSGLLVFFASFLMLVSFKMWTGWSPHKKGLLPHWGGMSGISFIIGNISAIAGIGGGTMTVPFLTWGQIAIQRAVAVSSTLGLPIAIAGTLGFFWRSGQQNLMLDSSQLYFGYVYLPAFFAIICTSILTARLGVYWSHRLSKKRLSQVFAVLLVILSIKLFYGVLSA